MVEFTVFELVYDIVIMIGFNNIDFMEKETLREQFESGKKERNSKGFII